MSKKKKDVTLLRTNSYIDFNDLNKGQQKAVGEILDWYHSKKRTPKDMIYRLGGVSGSGKSYIIQFLIHHLKLTTENCYVVAYTGQAVNVLRQRKIMAKTIHSTFMQAKDIPLLDRNGFPILHSGVPVMTTKFIPVSHIPSKIKLIICDEASFVSEKIQDIMLRYNVPILETGDPIQLPPVAGKECFKMDNLDFILTEIMRQEADSEIVKLATAIRNYQPVNRTEYWNDVKFIWAQDTIEDSFFQYKPFFKSSDVIITTSNKDRTIITDLYRKHIVKTDSPYPIKGEKLICRKNDWDLVLGDFPLTNGTQGTAVHTVAMSDVSKSTGTYLLDFKPNFIENEYYDGLLCDIKFLRKPFGNADDDMEIRLNPGKKFEYAYAITVNLDQGAEHDKVLFIDNWHRNPEYHMRQRYTAVTRAKKKLYYMLPRSQYGQYTDLWKGGFQV